MKAATLERRVTRLERALKRALLHGDLDLKVASLEILNDSELGELEEACNLAAAGYSESEIAEALGDHVFEIWRRVEDERQRLESSRLGRLLEDSQ